MLRLSSFQHGNKARELSRRVNLWEKDAKLSTQPHFAHEWETGERGEIKAVATNQVETL